MRNEAVAALLVIAILAGAGAGYLFGTSRQGVNNSTSAVSTQSSIDGLRLTAALNATSLKSGQRLGIAVSLYNTLPTTLNISFTGSWIDGEPTVPSGWKVVGFPIAMWDDCVRYQPVEFMIVKGNYNLSELQAASNSTEYLPRNWETCNGGQLNVDYFVFQPTSTNANLSGIECTNLCFPPKSFGSQNLASNFTVNGYWAYPLNSSEWQDTLTPDKPCSLPEICSPSVSFHFPEVGPTAQHLFISGLYTLIVDDEWGQVVILHFSVT